MTHTETLNILDELESLVSDQLQVVTDYFSIPQCFWLGSDDHFN